MLHTAVEIVVGGGLLILFLLAFFGFHPGPL